MLIYEERDWISAHEGRKKKNKKTSRGARNSFNVLSNQQRHQLHECVPRCPRAVVFWRGAEDEGWDSKRAVCRGPEGVSG